MINEVVDTLLRQMVELDNNALSIIDWSSPIPVFGDVDKSKVATVGLNPSDREFLDSKGNELNGIDRRFHTLESLNICSWRNARKPHIEKIVESYSNYFYKNPYSTWFSVLDNLINKASVSYYGGQEYLACHLDIVPFATSKKWSDLSGQTKASLIKVSSYLLPALLKDSSVEVLVLNGQGVVDTFEQLSKSSLHTKEITGWSLPRKKTKPVAGFSYEGVVSNLAGVDLGRSIHVIGYNHNMQSSFGVTTKVKADIGDWASKKINGVLSN